jgi:hypothetical protein
MIVLNIKADLKPMQRAFAALGSKQVPFATAVALTSLAKGVQADEDAAIVETFDNPTPFTRKSFAIVPATKSKPVAVVFPKDIQEQYLEPYVLGGPRSLGSKKAMLVPISQRTNQYGNLPRTTVARLMAKPGVFKGSIVTKSGKRVSGIWQRPMSRGGTVKGGLKLLIEFKDTTAAPKHLDFFGRANHYLRANAPREFASAMRKALANARP